VIEGFLGFTAQDAETFSIPRVTHNILNLFIVIFRMVVANG
jgi:hypothetical protein